MISEEWRFVVGYEGQYQVSNLGGIKSFKGRKERVLKIAWSKFSGVTYGHVSLSCCNSKENKLIHQAVAEAFLGLRPDGHVVRHLDGDSTNNRIDNLEYGTYGDNESDKIKHGRHWQLNKTHCPKGHEYCDDDYVSSTGYRQCQICKKEYMKEYNKAYKLRKRKEREKNG